ncbi:hypothetical protein Cgig2_031873 [Carnegiea gigantea]|uniref:Uncharacterized protein n=1 Tax=Carnegiea gigantea TaxID=171969 RepID=A0A9Q1KSN0_9CARY|nr:hypothetical protein Cgig2_031873 [Carnegiea gigantea]
MGRGGSIGRNQTLVAASDDPGSRGEKALASKRRGRPQKPLRDEIEEDEQIDKVEENVESSKRLITKNSEDQTDLENETKKRKSPLQFKENADYIEDGVSGGKPSTEDSIKPVTFRQNGSRRKSKPHRAAEVGRIALQYGPSLASFKLLLTILVVTPLS